MTTLHNPNQNQLLAALPEDEFKRLSNHLELVPMPLGMSYYESSGKLHHAYFPTTATISLRYVTESGASAEIACVGNEGMLGVSVILGSKVLPRQASVRTVGYGYRLKARLLQEEFNRGDTLQSLLVDYTKSLITQASHTVACNRYHTLEQRLFRCLLTGFDRISLDNPGMTHELLASSLGVARDMLSEPLKKLHQAGVANCYGTHVKLLNRIALERQACECYRAGRAEDVFEYASAAMPPAKEAAWELCSA